MRTKQLAFGDRQLPELPKERVLEPILDGATETSLN